MPCTHPEFHRELLSLLNHTVEPPPPEGNLFVNDCDETKCVVRFCGGCCVICTIGFISGEANSPKLAQSIIDDTTIKNGVFHCRLPNGSENPLWLTRQDLFPE